MTSPPHTAHHPRRLPGGVAGRVALVVGAAGLLILGHWADPTQGTAITRSLTLAALPLVLPLARWAVPPAPGPGGYLALAGGVLAGPIYSLFYDPLRDADCRQCLPGAFAIIPDVATAQALSLAGNSLVAAGLLASAFRRPLAPAPAALAVLGLLPLLGHAPAAALGGLAVPVLAWLGLLLARWWSAHQLSQLVLGLRDAEGLDPATLADLEARPALSPQARLGLAQVRLRLTLSEQAAQIDESRRRIVAREDQEARRLERDLHDGAQQYLLGLGMALLAEPQTPGTAQALKETHACIDDLRTVAREVSDTRPSSSPAGYDPRSPHWPAGG